MSKFIFCFTAQNVNIKFVFVLHCTKVQNDRKQINNA